MKLFKEELRPKGTKGIVIRVETSYLNLFPMHAKINNNEDTGSRLYWDEVSLIFIVSVTNY